MGQLSVDRICSIALWVIVIAAVLVFVKKLGGSRLVKFGSYASLAIAFILAVTLGTVFLTTELSDKKKAARSSRRMKICSPIPRTRIF